MATDINTNLAAAKCYLDLDESQRDSIQIVLLGLILGGTMPSINTMLAQGACYIGLSPDQREAIKLYLLSQVSGGGGGVGLIGTGSPEGVVTANPGAIYTDNTSPGNPGLWLKITGTGNTGWVNIITSGP